MQRFSDEELLAAIDEILPQVVACEPTPETRRILKELELGRRNLHGDIVDSTAGQIAVRAAVLAQKEQYLELVDRLIVVGHELEHREYRRRISPDEILKRFRESSCDLWSLFHDLRHWSEGELFEFLFPVACDSTTYPWPAPYNAAALLTMLDPRCPLTCRDALGRIGAGDLEIGRAHV